MTDSESKPDEGRTPSVSFMGVVPVLSPNAGLKRAKGCKPDRYSCRLFLHLVTPLHLLWQPSSGYEPEGREFESLRAHHSFNSLGHPLPGALCLLSENCPQNPNRDKCSSPWRPSRLHSLSP